MRALLMPVAALAMAAASPVGAKDAELSGMALQQIQARDFETTSAFVFPAVMTVLQDAGFRIQTADKETGLITAIGSTEAKTTFNIWWGIGKKKKTPVVSAFIEQRGPNVTRARLNFVMSTGKDRNVFSDEKPVSDPAVYRDAFEKIEKEIFVRQAMAAPASAPAVVPVGSTAAAAAAVAGGPR